MKKSVYLGRGIVTLQAGVLYLQERKYPRVKPVCLEVNGNGGSIPHGRCGRSCRWTRRPIWCVTSPNKAKNDRIVWHPCLDEATGA